MIFEFGVLAFWTGWLFWFGVHLNRCHDQCMKDGTWAAYNEPPFDTQMWPD